MQDMMKNDREQAVSEAIGFMVLFSLVTLGIALVSLYGYPVLMQQQISAHDRNMEQTMIVLQNDIKSLCYKNIPYKETSLSVGGGFLAAHSNDTVTQKFEISPSNETSIEFEPGELRYESDAGETILALENGAVVKRQKQQTGSVMVGEPRWFYDSDTRTLVINNIAIHASEMMSRTGVGVVRLQVSGSPPEMFDLTYLPEPERWVRVNYTANPAYSYSKAWENYFVNSLGMTQTGSDFEKSDVDTLIVKTYTIKVLSL